MVHVDSLFWERLADFADAPALINANAILTYRELCRGAEAFAEKLGTRRRLVFLEIDNSPGAITAYLGCLIGRHPVFPFGRADRDKVRRLVETYRPNLVADASAEPQWLNHEVLDLHPDLRVLLSTSGSTGSAKLVKLSGTSLDANARAIAQYLELAASDRAITLLKPHYSYGLSVLHSHLVCGAGLVLTEDSVTDSSFWQSVHRAGATSFAGVPYTFETLARTDFRFSDHPSLRTATQAGGRLAPALVRRFARAAAEAGARFFVMYGQTEAGPRMAYLPPHQAEAHPGAIGIAIPGGRISLVDEHGHNVSEPGRAGEIVYRGPNMMMGYALGPADLATDDTPEALHTGDVATWDRQGLLTIVGRAARFVKLFGKRVNLDEVEAHLRADGLAAACAGNDKGIVVAIERTLADCAPALSEAFDLPTFAFQVVHFDMLPRLANGKLDYPAILARQTIAPEAPSVLRAVLSRRFVRQVAIEAATIVGLTKPRWASVADIFHRLVGPAAPDDSFSGLGGDSMSYVQVSLALEEFLGRLPDAWEHRPIGELERMRGGVF